MSPRGGQKSSMRRPKSIQKLVRGKSEEKHRKSSWKSRLGQSISCTLVTKSHQKGDPGRRKKRPKRTRLRYFSKSVIFQKPMFYLSKTTHFECRRGVKSSPKAPKQSKQITKKTWSKTTSKQQGKRGQKWSWPSPNQLEYRHCGAPGSIGEP